MNAKYRPIYQRREIKHLLFVSFFFIAEYKLYKIISISIKYILNFVNLPPKCMVSQSLIFN